MAKLAAILVAANAMPVFAASERKTKEIVIVHGAFADGSGWEKVAAILQKDDYSVAVSQPLMTSLEDDVTAARQVIDRHRGPVVLVGHSYGGAVITEAGNDPKVIALVYVAAFVPDEGESVGSLLKGEKLGSPSVPPSGDLYPFLDPTEHSAAFASELQQSEASYLAMSQMPEKSKAYGSPIKSPAWKSRPTYGVVATQDRIINPYLERTMYTRASAQITEIKGSHVAFISHPEAVARVIEQAAQNPT